MRYMHLDHSFTVNATATVTLTEGGQICGLRLTAVAANGEPVELHMDFVDDRSELPLLQEAVDEKLGQNALWTDLLAKAKKEATK